MTELGRAYGSALYALAEDEKQEDAFLSQLGEVCKLLADNPDYVRLIKDKAIAKTERLALLDGAFSGQIHPYLLNFMKLLCERGAFGAMAACQAEYISCYNEKHGIVPAKVFSAEALSDEQLARLKAALERTSGKHVTLDVHVDAALVGGMRVEMAGSGTTTTTTTTTTDTTVLGDVDGNGKVEVNDLVRLARYVAQDQELTPALTAQQVTNADVNCDGTVDASDITMIARALARLTSLEDFGK